MYSNNNNLGRAAWARGFAVLCAAWLTASSIPAMAQAIHNGNGHAHLRPPAGFAATFGGNAGSFGDDFVERYSTVFTPSTGTISIGQVVRSPSGRGGIFMF